MRFQTTVFLISSLCLIGSLSQAADNTIAKAKPRINVCQDSQVLLGAAQGAIQDAMDNDVDDSVSDYLVLAGDPILENQNRSGKDLWSVPVVVDGEGCYGSVYITVKAGTCEIIEAPSFDGVSCTDD
jgi:hypothetical protein